MTALVLAFLIAGVHLALVEDRYREARYVGALFAVGAMGIVSAAGVAAGGRKFGRLAVVLSWLTGAVIAAGMLIGFLLARTTGLPGYHPNDWPAIQLMALGAETAYLLLSVRALYLWALDARAEHDEAESPYPGEQAKSALHLR